MSKEFLVNLQGNFQDKKRDSGMEEQKQSRRFGFSLQGRLFVSIFVMLAITIFVVAGFSLLIFEQNAKEIQRSNQMVMEDQAKENLLNITGLYSRHLGLYLDQMLGYGQELSRAIVAMNINLENFGVIETRDPERQMQVFSEGQYGNMISDVTSIFLPSTEKIDATALRAIQLSNVMEWVVPDVLESHPEISAMYFVSPDNLIRYYPNIYLLETLPPDYEATKQPWYIQALPHIRNNKSFFSLPYQGLNRDSLITTGTVPVLGDDSSLIGVVGVDIPLDHIVDILQDDFKFETGYSFLINTNGIAIVFPEKAYQDILNRQPALEELTPNLNLTATNFTGVINLMRAGKAGLSSIQVGDRKIYISYTLISETNWSLGIVVDHDELMERTQLLQQDYQRTTQIQNRREIILVGIVVFLAMSISAAYITNLILGPFGRLSSAAKKILSGHSEVDLPIQASGDVRLIAQSITAMNELIVESSNLLTEQVNNQTLSISNHLNRVKTAAKLARELSASQNVELAMRLSVKLLIDNFEYEHVEIYSVDQKREFLVLQAASGEVGRVMMDQGYQVRVASTSVMGTVVLSGEPKIFNVTLENPTFTGNTLRSGTRSEMAVPIIWNQKVMGVIDVHSFREHVFNQQDIEVLELFADQLATAITTVNLHQENAEMKDQMAKLQNQFSLGNWQSPKKLQKPLGFQYDTNGLVSLTNTQILDHLESAHYTFPICIRGEIVALLEIWPKGINLTPGEEKVLEMLVDRLGQALESAWLYEEAQKRAAREVQINQITTQVRGSVSLDGILRNTVSEIGRVFGNTITFIKIGSLPEAGANADSNGSDQ